METKYITINVKQTAAEKAEIRKMERAANRAINFWKIATVFMVVMFLISVHIGVKNIETVNELSSELLDTRVELARVQEAYRVLENQPTEAPRESPISISSDIITLSEVFTQTIPVDNAVERSDLSASVVNYAPVPDALAAFAEVPITDDLRAYIYNQAIDAGLKPEVMFALGWKESDFTADLISATNDYGMFQINQCNFGTLAEAFGKDPSDMAELLMDPYFCCDCSIWLLNDIRNNYKPENYHQMLMMYNMGPGGARKCFRNGKYSSEYSRAIMNYATNTYGLTTGASWE